MIDAIELATRAQEERVAVARYVPKYLEKDFFPRQFSYSDERQLHKTVFSNLQTTPHWFSKLQSITDEKLIPSRKNNSVQCDWLVIRLVGDGQRVMVRVGCAACALACVACPLACVGGALARPPCQRLSLSLLPRTRSNDDLSEPVTTSLSLSAPPRRALSLAQVCRRRPSEFEGQFARVARAPLDLIYHGAARATAVIR